ncbi:hypothetical protein AB7M22_002662 [Pseudomonas sp. ADAK2 TE3594]
MSKPLFAGARLAGEDALKDAFVGTPGACMGWDLSQA